MKDKFTIAQKSPGDPCSPHSLRRRTSLNLTMVSKLALDGVCKWIAQHVIVSVCLCFLYVLFVRVICVVEIHSFLLLYSIPL